MNLVDRTFLRSYISKHNEYEDVRERIVQEGGKIAQDAREASGLSLRRYAAELKVSAGYLSHIETGRDVLSPEIARKMLQWEENRNG